MKKIFLEAHNLKNPFSGFGQFNKSLLEAFAKLDHDFDFTIHANKEDLTPTLSENFTVKNYRSLTRYPAFRIRKKYDLWHSLNQNIKTEPLHKIPYLLTVHDIAFMNLVEDPEKVFPKKIKQFKEKLKRVHGIAYISEYAKNSTRSHFDIPEVPERVIYNGNPVRTFNAGELQAVNQPPQAPFLFTIGKMVPHKNFQSLIGLIARLPDFDLLIAGDNNTSFFNELQLEISRNNLGNRVKIIGKISENDKHWYYQNCEAFLFPSLHEGFGFPPLEAMAYGKPVFAANKTSLPEVCGQHAFYWDHFDPEYMTEIFSKGLNAYHDHKEEMTAKYQKQSAKFDWDKTALSYLDFYKELTS